MEIEIDKLEDNLKELSVELTALKHITDRLDIKGDQQIHHWLQNVERIAGDNDEMQAQLCTLRRPYASNNHNGRADLDETLIKELSVKVIQNLEAVQALKEPAFQTFLLQITQDKLKRYSHDDLIMFTSKFSNKIGFGGFSQVYLGRLSDGVQVAVKVLRQNRNIPKDVLRDIFMIEVSTMIKASHPNLIKLYGFCFDDNMKALIYEYMENGSLDKVLFKKHIVVEWPRLYEIAIDTAKVLAYLHHDCDDQIIHHDIKPANILLDSNLSAKVTDFGVAKIMNRDVTHFTMTRTRGTSCYIAPEMTMQASRVTYTCDVYGFGMTLFDILGMRINSQTQPLFPNEVWRKFDKGKLDEILKECDIWEEDAESARILSMVALWCIQFTPETRPSMKDVVNVLEKNLQVAEPPNPFLASDKLFSIIQSQDMTYSTVSTSTRQSLPRGNSTVDTFPGWEEFVEVLPQVRPSMKDVNVPEKNWQLAAPPSPFLVPHGDKLSPEPPNQFLVLYEDKLSPEYEDELSPEHKLSPIKQSKETTYSTSFPSTSQRSSAAQDTPAQFASQGESQIKRLPEEMTRKQPSFSEMDDSDASGREPSAPWGSGNSPYLTPTHDDPNSLFSPLPPVLEEPSSSFSEAEEDDPMPAIDSLQISGEAFPGQYLQACGYSINGTTSCNFEWVRYLEDGSVNYIDGAKQPSYLVTADDVDTYLAIEVQPLDNRKRKGELVKAFANEQRKITCDLEMQEQIERSLHNGNTSYEVSFADKYLDIWEPAILAIKMEGYSIKCIGARGVVVREKFMQKTTVGILFGHPTAFSILGSSEHLLRTGSSTLRDTIVLTMRLFIMKAGEKKKKH